MWTKGQFNCCKGSLRIQSPYVDKMMGLIQIWFTGQMYVEVPEIKINENPSSIFLLRVDAQYISTDLINWSSVGFGPSIEEYI